jgi:SWIM zinc finger
MAAELQSTSLQYVLKASQELTLLGGGLLESQWQAQNLYGCCAVTPHTYHVVNVMGATENSVVPTFRRVRVVTIEGNVLQCSCGYYERIGIPCRHILRVMVLTCGGHDGEGPPYEPDKADIAPRWHKLYKKYAFARKLNRDSMEVCKQMESLALSEPKGPRVRHDLREIPPPFEPSVYAIRDTVDTCTNYTRGQIEAALQRQQAVIQGADSTLPPAGMLSLSSWNDQAEFGEESDKNGPVRVDANWADSSNSRHAYSYMKTIFEDFLRQAEGDKDEMVNMRNHIEGASLRIKSKHWKGEACQGKYISTNVPNERKRKSHDTRYKI